MQGIWNSAQPNVQGMATHTHPTHTIPPQPHGASILSYGPVYIAYGHGGPVGPHVDPARAVPASTPGVAALAHDQYPAAAPAAAPLPVRTHDVPRVTLTLRVTAIQGHTRTITIPLFKTTNYGYGSPRSLDQHLAEHGFPSRLLEAGRVWVIQVGACGMHDVERWLDGERPEPVANIHPDGRAPSRNLVGQLDHIFGDSTRHWKWWLRNIWFGGGCGAQRKTGQLEWICRVGKVLLIMRL